MTYVVARLRRRRYYNARTHIIYFIYTYINLFIYYKYGGECASVLYMIMPRYFIIVTHDVVSPCRGLIREPIGTR